MTPRTPRSKAGRVMAGFLLPCLAFWLGMGVAAVALAQTYSEDAVKAAFLHRFTAYVEWPTQEGRDVPFIIAVVGADSVASQLDRLLPGLTIHDRRAQVRRVERASDLQGAQLLYIGSGHLRTSQALITAAKRLPVLLVTDDEDGLTSGSIINFVRSERTVRFEVSLTAAERTGLKINSGLLAVAARVEGRPQAGLRCTDFPRSWTCLPLLASQDTWR